MNALESGFADGLKRGACFLVLSSLLIVGCWLCMPASGVAQEAVRPTLAGPLRYNQDWSFLRDPSNHEGQWWEPLKFIPMDEAGDVYVTVGNELRYRFEYLRNPNWGEEETDPNGYHWMRVLPSADLHLGRSVQLFGELILAPSSGVAPYPTGLDDDVADLLQGFLKLSANENTHLSIGRKVLNIGSGRMISTRYGINVLQTFDMIDFFHGDEKQSIYFLCGRPIDSQVGAFNDDWSRTRQGWTVYWTRDLVDAGVSPSGGSSFLDLYYMGFENTQGTFNQITGLEQRQTLAARLHGRRNRWRWDHELFVQLGRFTDQDIQAWSLATLVGYKRDDMPLTPEFSLQFNTISGDTNPNDGKLETFHPLFPKLKYFGESGVISPRNLFYLNPGIDLHLTDDIRLSGDIQFLWRYSTDDGVYGPGTRLLRASGNSDSRYIATQYELGLEIDLTENWTCAAYYVTMPPGAFIRDTGEAKTIQFVGVQTVLSY